MTLQEATAARDALLKKMDGVSQVSFGDRSVRSDTADEIIKQIAYFDQLIASMTPTTQRNSTCTLASFSKG